MKSIPLKRERPRTLLEPGPCVGDIVCWGSGSRGHDEPERFGEVVDDRAAAHVALEHVRTFVVGRVRAHHERRAHAKVIRDREVELVDVADHRHLIGPSAVLAPKLFQHGAVVRSIEQDSPRETWDVQLRARFRDVLLRVADHTRVPVQAERCELLPHSVRVAVGDEDDLDRGNRVKRLEDVAEIFSQRSAALCVVRSEQLSVELTDPCFEAPSGDVAPLEDPTLDRLAAQVRIDDRRSDGDAVHDPAVIIGLSAETLLALFVVRRDDVARLRGHLGERVDEGLDEAFAFFLHVRAGSVEVEDDELRNGHCLPRVLPILAT